MILRGTLGPTRRFQSRMRFGLSPLVWDNPPTSLTHARCVAAKSCKRAAQVQLKAATSAPRRKAAAIFVVAPAAPNGELFFL